MHIDTVTAELTPCLMGSQVVLAGHLSNQAHLLTKLLYRNRGMLYTYRRPSGCLTYLEPLLFPIEG